MSAAQRAAAVLCIAGPTASGKSAAALALAYALGQRQRPVEIISVDSALVYRGMDIGSAKPSAAERAAVPHHLIDIIEPSQSYSAARFVADTQRLIGEIRARGAQPLLVGGTMLYFKALFEGLHAMPAAQPQVRAQIEREAAALGWSALHAQLALVDPPTAARLAPADGQRIGRALEVWRVTGTPMSTLHATKKIASNEGNTPAYRLISLEPGSRAWLHARIAQRLDAMLAAGLVAEVQALRSQPGVAADLPSMRCVGYRQAWQALDGDFPLAELHERCLAATRQLAKRQLTWLRGFGQRTVLACDASDASAELIRLALEPAPATQGCREPA